jgi:hypothetical protein
MQNNSELDDWYVKLRMAQILFNFFRPWNLHAKFSLTVSDNSWRIVSCISSRDGFINARMGSGG